jgi:hypothetical protein
MAGPTLSRFLGLFRLRDASNASRMAAVNAAGEVSVTDTRLGEVQASPTQYTVLDRLKTIATALAGVLSVKGAGTTNKTATIAMNDSAGLSDVVDLGVGYQLVGIQMPSAWTAAKLTFRCSADGVTYANKFDRYGSEFEIPTQSAAASQYIQLEPSDFLGVRYVMVRSGSSATPVTQAGGRALTLVAVA